MNEFTVLCAVVALIGLFVTMEIVSAVLPLILVLALVPPQDRAGLAQVIAAADSSRKLRLWPALRLAVAARRDQRPHTPDRTFAHAGAHRHAEDRNAHDFVTQEQRDRAAGG
jgi:hypothetical protein